MIYRFDFEPDTYVLIHSGTQCDYIINPETGTETTAAEAVPAYVINGTTDSFLRSCFDIPDEAFGTNCQLEICLHRMNGATPALGDPVIQCKIATPTTICSPVTEPICQQPVAEIFRKCGAC